MSNDGLVRGTILAGRARVFACVSTELVGGLQRRHDTWPVATAALGRTATIAAMIGMTLKNEERITVRIKGDGPLGEIVVEANEAGQVRGYVDVPHVDLPSNAMGKLDVSGSVGSGLLYVIRDTGLKDYYTSSAELQTGEIADDFTYYFAVSEQTPSLVAAGVLVNTDDTVICSGGLIVQLLPGYEESDVVQLETRLSGLTSVTDLLRDGMDAEVLLHTVLPESRILERKPLVFACSCSRQRFERALYSLGTTELKRMLHDEQNEVEVICHFCSTRYEFGEADICALLTEREKHDPGASGGNHEV